MTVRIIVEGDEPGAVARVHSALKGYRVLTHTYGTIAPEIVARSTADPLRDALAEVLTGMHWYYGEPDLDRIAAHLRGKGLVRSDG